MNITIDALTGRYTNVTIRTKEGLRPRLFGETIKAIINQYGQIKMSIEEDKGVILEKFNKGDDEEDDEGDEKDDEGFNDLYKKNSKKDTGCVIGNPEDDEDDSEEDGNESVEDPELDSDNSNENDDTSYVFNSASLEEIRQDPTSIFSCGQFIVSEMTSIDFGALFKICSKDITYIDHFADHLFFPDDAKVCEFIIINTLQSKCDIKHFLSRVITNHKFLGILIRNGMNYREEAISICISPKLDTLFKDFGFMRDHLNMSYVKEIANSAPVKTIEAMINNLAKCGSNLWFPIVFEALTAISPECSDSKALLKKMMEGIREFRL